MICAAVMLAGSSYYFSKIGLAGSYDFEVAVSALFPADDVRPTNVIFPS